VPHQANLRIIEAAASRLGVPLDRTFVNIDRYGNTSAASIPMALSKLMESSPLPSGAPILLFAFGGGLSYAGQVVHAP
jgi:3-oxoacyl-[acyl-carrier-protein] synthase-3